MDSSTTTTVWGETPVEPATILAPSPPEQAPNRPHNRHSTLWRVVVTVLTLVAVLLLGAALAAFWALNRFVIDHVEIADVAAYEAVVTGDNALVDGSAGRIDEPSTGSTAERADDAGAAITTATTYQDQDTSIDISTVVTGSGRETVTHYVADVVLSDATHLRAGFANNQFGNNITADTSDIAGYYDAVFAINGDYYGFRDTGIVIRNGVASRGAGVRTGLAVFTDGTMSVYDETTTSAEELLASGVWNTWSFGPALLDDGQVVEGIEDVEVDTNFGNHSIQGNQPRNGIGIIDDNHFVLVVVDGRSTGYSRGVTMTDFAEIFQELGATVAYNLDGGGSATMYFNGEIVNNPLGEGDERGTSDILYVAAG
jgi:exopolysaccharide biosynthesis protein